MNFSTYLGLEFLELTPHTPKLIEEQFHGYFFTEIWQAGENVILFRYHPKM